MVSAVKAGTALRMGIDHPEYNYTVDLDETQRAALAADLD
jgi:hypothetical protein